MSVDELLMPTSQFQLPGDVVPLDVRQDVQQQAGAAVPRFPSSRLGQDIVLVAGGLWLPAQTVPWRKYLLCLSIVVD